MSWPLWGSNSSKQQFCGVWGVVVLVSALPGPPCRWASGAALVVVAAGCAGAGAAARGAAASRSN